MTPTLMTFSIDSMILMTRKEPNLGEAVNMSSLEGFRQATFSVSDFVIDGVLLG